MKKHFLALLFIAGIISHSFGQSPVCGTMDLLKEELKNDPSLATQIQQSEAELQQWISKNQTNYSNSVYTIPVVIHIVYKNSAQNLTNAQVTSQITVLNEDFSRKNSDTVNTPVIWKTTAGNPNVQFCLAKTDPNGNPTNGIIRKLAPSTANFTSADNNVKSPAMGGDTAWDPNKYFNIWICDIASNILGYAKFPSTGVNYAYGFVLDYTATGRNGSASYPYNLGRSGTHEAGHCFGLYHVWGDDDASANMACNNVSSECVGTDYCTDTPNQCVMNFGAPSYPQTDYCSQSSPGVMYMDYMDYSDDRARNMFTNNQVSRITGSINAYLQNLVASTACNAPTGVFNPFFETLFSVYPNPASDEITIDGSLSQQVNIEVSLYNSLGREMINKEISGFYNEKINLDVSGLPSGIYLLNVRSSIGMMTQKILIQH